MHCIFVILPVLKSPLKWVRQLLPLSAQETQEGAGCGVAPGETSECASLDVGLCWATTHGGLAH
jgi:hypothetical protein